MSLAEKMYFLQDVFQMINTALVIVINYHINGVHLFWDILYFSPSKKNINFLITLLHRDLLYV